MVSHEFRTPLSIIQSSAEIMEDYFDRLPPAKRKDHLQSIRKNTRRMCRNLTTILCMENFNSLSAENGRVGLELAKKEMPDLILCDIMMPELDGYAVIAALRAHPKTATIPFIFLTAKGDKPDIRTGMNLGADDYLTKPVANHELLAAIRSRLEHAAQRARPGFKPNFKSARLGGAKFAGRSLASEFLICQR